MVKGTTSRTGQSHYPSQNLLVSESHPCAQTSLLIACAPHTPVRATSLFFLSIPCSYRPKQLRRQNPPRAGLNQVAGMHVTLGQSCRPQPKTPSWAAQQSRSPRKKLTLLFPFDEDCKPDHISWSPALRECRTPYTGWESGKSEGGCLPAALPSS